MTDTDVAVLAVAGRFYRQPGAREQAALDELGLSPTAFWQRLNRLLDDPVALASDPPTVNRLRRLRAARMAARGH